MAKEDGICRTHLRNFVEAAADKVSSSFGVAFFGEIRRFAVNNGL